MSTVDPAPLSELEDLLGIAFGDPTLLRRAVTHRSWCAEHDEPVSNERLEFLGDSVLGLVVTDHVYECYPDLPEGTLSEVRAGVVNSEVLAHLARELSLGRYLLLGKGEDAAGGRAKQSILADALEALIAAVYLEGGLEAARPLILEWLGERITEIVQGSGGRDPKTRLQELAAQRGLGRPRYEVQGEGPDHERRFFATVYLDGEAFGDGEGRTKKQAEQAAAWVAHAALSGPSEGEEDAGAA
jgi:ribonuclease-3